CKVTNLVKTIEALKKAGIWVFGLDRHGKDSIFQQDLSEGIAIVTGGEEKGIRPLVRKHCDHLVSIPQQGPLNSLNASVAGAVAMYEAFRQWELKKAIRNKKGA
ncbi:RNA methyltransferase, partial [Desulfobacterales bacterium HSG16]|nr:RNA methyltransferase [Desulfobacterales bacterium HSG16]